MITKETIERAFLVECTKLLQDPNLTLTHMINQVLDYFVDELFKLQPSEKYRVEDLIISICREKHRELCTVAEEITNTGISRTKQWFDLAVLEPTPKNKMVQIGCHLEEAAEMMTAIGQTSLADTIDQSADNFKKGLIQIPDELIDREALLDSLVDQIVTAIGVAHMYRMDIIGALDEVNRSNFSKFVAGKPIFDENGKIRKGPDYLPPDLTSFV